MAKNSLIEMLICTFLTFVEKYTKNGLNHSYKREENNLSRIKGKILFNKQFSKNVLKLTKFWCGYSKFTSDNTINQFFKLCLKQMNEVSRDPQNKRRIRFLLPIYEGFQDISKEKALAREIAFNSTNQNAEESYTYGKLFLKNIFSTLSAGNVPINMMLFNMNDLYELFVYKVTHMVYGNRAAYQMRGNYLLKRDIDAKKFIALRPDIAVKQACGEFLIVDTKWKIPQKFAKESDVYQMNAYSTGIHNVKEIILLYPLVKDGKMVDDYNFIDASGNKRPLKIRTIDVMKCLKWKQFLLDFSDVIR